MGMVFVSVAVGAVAGVITWIVMVHVPNGRGGVPETVMPAGKVSVIFAPV